MRSERLVVGNRAYSAGSRLGGSPAPQKRLLWMGTRVCPTANLDSRSGQQERRAERVPLFASDRLSMIVVAAALSAPVTAAGFGIFEDVGGTCGARNIRALTILEVLIMSFHR